MRHKPLVVAFFLPAFSALADPVALGPSGVQCLEMEERIDQALVQGTEEAAERLAACGPRVVSHIEERMDGLPPEQADHLKRILALIEGPSASGALAALSAQEKRPAAEALDGLRTVAGEDQGPALPPQIEEGPLALREEPRVPDPQGLVQDEDPLGHGVQRGGDGEPGAHAGGVLADGNVQEALKP